MEELQEQLDNLLTEIMEYKRMNIQYEEAVKLAQENQSLTGKNLRFFESKLEDLLESRKALTEKMKSFLSTVDKSEIDLLRASQDFRETSEKISKDLEETTRKLQEEVQSLLQALQVDLTVITTQQEKRIDKYLEKALREQTTSLSQYRDEYDSKLQVKATELESQLNSTFTEQAKRLKTQYLIILCTVIGGLILTSAVILLFISNWLD